MGSPSFLILGCQKGGTTTLYEALRRHPQVAGASAKELQFFSLNYQRGTDWYRSQFPERADLVSGEATPYYLFHPLAAERIARHLSRIRLIVLLRDPIRRALSHYFHAQRLGVEHLALAEALAAEPGRLADAETVLAHGGHHPSHQEHSYVSRSRYGPQLQRFADLFPRGQLLVLRSEEFFTDPTGVVGAVHRFLGVQPVEHGAIEPLNQGHGENLDVTTADEEVLEGLLRGERVVMEGWLATHGIEAHASATQQGRTAGLARDLADTRSVGVGHTA